MFTQKNGDFGAISMNVAKLRRADLENGALQIVTHIADQVIGPEAEVNKERGSGTH